MSDHAEVKLMLDMQNKYEQWFSCIVCLCPKTRMIFGLCQHKVCEDCLYDENNLIKPALKSCPICQIITFPFRRPPLPQDNIEMMKCLGITECPNHGCNVELWSWELENHTKHCKNKPELEVTKRVLRRNYKNKSTDNVKPKRLPSSRQKYGRLRSGRLRAYSLRSDRV